MQTDTIEDRQSADVAQSKPQPGEPTYNPAVDILEHDDELLLLADVPGVRAADIDIKFERGVLALHGRVVRREADGQTEYLLREYGVGDFRRSFGISEDIDPSGIRAEVDNGVLTVHLPKADAVKPKKIEVRSAR